MKEIDIRNEIKTRIGDEYEIIAIDLDEKARKNVFGYSIYLASKKAVTHFGKILTNLLLKRDVRVFGRMIYSPFCDDGEIYETLKEVGMTFDRYCITSVVHQSSNIDTSMDILASALNQLKLRHFDLYVIDYTIM